MKLKQHFPLDFVSEHIQERVSISQYKQTCTHQICLETSLRGVGTYWQLHELFLLVQIQVSSLLLVSDMLSGTAISSGADIIDDEHNNLLGADMLVQTIALCFRKQEAFLGILLLTAEMQANDKT